MLFKKEANFIMALFVGPGKKGMPVQLGSVGRTGGLPAAKGRLGDCRGQRNGLADRNFLSLAFELFQWERRVDAPV